MWQFATSMNIPVSEGLHNELRLATLGHLDCLRLGSTTLTIPVLINAHYTNKSQVLSRMELLLNTDLHAIQDIKYPIIFCVKKFFVRTNNVP